MLQEIPQTPGKKVTPRMLYRRTGQLALQTTLLLAWESDGAPRRIRELADELGVGANYLTKIVQHLSRAGLVRAVRGPGGGLQLARPAQEIHPWDVLSAVEPSAVFTQCLLGGRQCNEAIPCPLHGVWAPARDRIRHILQTKNLQEFAAEARRSGIPYWEPVPRTDARPCSSVSERRTPEASVEE
ncbi:MAG: RrF2 family transcriptional regulator [Terriglobia bacterium]